MTSVSRETLCSGALLGCSDEQLQAEEELNHAWGDHVAAEQRFNIIIVPSFEVHMTADGDVDVLCGLVVHDDGDVIDVTWRVPDLRDSLSVIA